MLNKDYSGALQNSLVDELPVPFFQHNKLPENHVMVLFLARVLFD